MRLVAGFCNEARAFVVICYHQRFRELMQVGIHSQFELTLALALA